MTGGRLKTAAGLFWYFFRIGWYTFGGGWSIVAQIEKDFVEKRGEITSGELLDIVSVGKSLPGLMIGNAAYLFGHHLAGVPGGVLAVLGISIPPLVLLSFLTVGYRAVRDNVWVERMLSGVRCVVAPVIVSAVGRLCRGAFPQRACLPLGVLTPTFTLCAAAAIFFERFKNSPLLKQMMLGVRPVCIGLVCAVLVDLFQSSYLAGGAPVMGNLLIGILALALLLKAKWSVPKVILIGGLLGLLFAGS